jgi:hypothetical protein
VRRKTKEQRAVFWRRIQAADNSLVLLEIDMPVVFLTIKIVYGVPKIYPATLDLTATRLARLVGTKTFSAQNIADIRALGFEIQYNDAYTDAQI